MIKKTTSTKREREKVKQNKREEKQKRKNERLGNESRSFEEMLAYVDENGVLHSTPQNIKPKEEIDASEILVSTPKQVEVEADAPLNGQVAHFNASKGFGFIREQVSREKYFFHISQAPAGINENDMVTFEIERGPRGMNAVNISIVPQKSNKNNEIL